MIEERTLADDTPSVPATRRVHEPPEVPAATMPPIVQRFGADASGNVRSRTPTPLTQETTDDGTRVVLEPMRIPPPDLIKTNSDIKITVTGSKRGKSGLRFDLYKSATTPAEYFRLHPGPNTPDMGKVTATAEWKFDVKHGHIRFEDNRYNDLAASYGMRGEELSVFFAEHPEDYEAAVEAYEKALRLDPNNAQVKTYLRQAKAKLAPQGASARGAAGGDADDAMMRMVNEPFMQQVMQNPDIARMTQDMMSNPGAMAEMMNNPALKSMMANPEMMRVRAPHRAANSAPLRFLLTTLPLLSLSLGARAANGRLARGRRPARRARQGRSTLDAP